MPAQKIKRALISVYDKAGIVDFARALVEEFGIQIISTGGTARLLKENKLPVTLVEEITGAAEMLDGRVKTLHPKIFAAILADRDNPQHMQQLSENGIEPIDMVVVNLYPFEKTVSDPNCTFEQAIEMIDIGGPALLRAAAKNHKHVLVVAETDEVTLEKVFYYIRDYDRSVPGDDLHLRFAKRAFWITSDYDERVHRWLQSQDVEPCIHRLVYTEWDELRYGENPHQVAKLVGWEVSESNEATVIYGEVTHPEQEQLSYNNYADGAAALLLCGEITREWNKNFQTDGRPQKKQKAGHPSGDKPLSVCVFIKHTNACGVGVADDVMQAYQRAYWGDPKAAMGGVLACGFDVDAEFARAVMETFDRWGKPLGAGGFFIEVWVAPGFSDDAVKTIRTLKPWGERVRLLAVGDMLEPPDEKEWEYRSIPGGMLAQARDLIGLNEDDWKAVTKREPTASELADLRLAWMIAKHTKSNAVSICKDGMLIGNGAGQMSRVMSCRIATWLAGENGHAERLHGAAAASDGFFPFPDGPNVLLDAGITAIIQPGGSKRDDETIQACDKRGAAMIFTGTRHFKH